MDGGSEDDNEDEEKEEKNEESKEATIDLCSDVPNTSASVSDIHYNYPMLCQLYKDPENQFNKVVMAVTIPSGAQKVRVELSNDGLTVFVKYNWPKTMFNFDDMFKKQLDNQEMNILHPKILCLKNALESVRTRVDSMPEAFMKVKLPIKVQTASDTWSKRGIKREDGTNVVLAEFKGYIKEYNKKANDSGCI